MNRQLVLTAILAATCLTSPVLAADLYTKAPRVAPPVPYADWSGVYLGIQGGYGWGKQSFDVIFDSFGGPGDAGNIANILNGTESVLFPAFSGSGVGPFDSIKQKGWLFGGFAGVQKQWGSWVLGLEADFDATRIKGTANSSGVTHNEQVTTLSFGFPTVVSVTNPGQNAIGTGTATIDAVSIIVPGQTITSNGTVPAQTITIPVSAVTGTINPNTTSICPCTLTFTLPIIGSVSVPIPAINVPVNGQVGVPGQSITVAIPAQNIAVTGSTIPVTVTVPGQAAPVTVVTNVSGITSTGTVQTPVLQQFQQVTDVARSVSIETKIDELGSVRGKFGLVPAENWLLYVTGGLALAHVTNTVTATESFDLNIGGGIQHFNRQVSASGGATLLGWALGAGVDWKFTTNPSLVFGIQYLHYEFPKNTIALSDGGGSAFNMVNSRQSVDVVKGRLSYLFNIN
jgi:opacity protein-like surface antigen